MGVNVKRPGQSCTKLHTASVTGSCKKIRTKKKRKTLTMYCAEVANCSGIPKTRFLRWAELMVTKYVTKKIHKEK
jgi:hypothetical protein